jgi:sterol desaturase/sphingolipid hydroxylase (fatty acid hydroxylase superfamily)
MNGQRCADATLTARKSGADARNRRCHTMTTLELIANLLGAAIVLLLPLEIYVLWCRGQFNRARWMEMLASISPFLPTLLTGTVVLAFISALYFGAAALTPMTIPTNPFTIVLCVLLVDFCYYWDHRAGHQNRLYWAISHSVHHSSHQYDQTTGLRVSFIDGFLSPWFYLPAVLLGFEPALVLASLLFILGWQQWLHTELVGKLPLLDGWLNTPSNHRVHHGVQPQYLDRNFGAVLMVWDRLFGTYAAEVEPVRYGLTDPIASANPLKVHLCEALRLWRALRSARGWRLRLALLWHRPGWSPSSESAPL